MKDDKVGGNVTCTGIRNMHVDFLWGHLDEEDRLEDLDVDGRMIEWMSKK
jgi:hypothetical protein